MSSPICPQICFVQNKNWGQKFVGRLVAWPLGPLRSASDIVRHQRNADAMPLWAIVFLIILSFGVVC